MAKAKFDRVEYGRICNLIRDMPPGEHADVVTQLSSRQLPSWLGNVKDSAGHSKFYSCSTIPDGVRVRCTDTIKISNVRSSQ